MIWRTRPGRRARAGAARRSATTSRWLLLGDARLHERGDLLDRRAQVAAARLDLELAGLDPRDVEQVVDEVDEAVGRLQRDLDELLLALGEVVVLGRLQQLDEALDRRQRAAQLVRGGRDEVALGLLQARALGDVAQRPDACRRRRPARRAAVTAIVTPSWSIVTSPACASPRARGSGLRGPCAAIPGRSSATSSRGARVHRRDAVGGVADDEAVAEALHRRRQPLALGLHARARGGEVGAHDVERLAERGELGRALGLDAHLQVAAGHPPRGVDERVQRAAHRADQQRQEGEHADEREAGAEPDRDQRRARAPRASRGRRRGARPGAAASARTASRTAGRRAVGARARRGDRRTAGERARGVPGGGDAACQRAAAGVLGGELAHAAAGCDRARRPRARRTPRPGASAARARLDSSATAAVSRFAAATSSAEVCEMRSS